MSAHRPVLLDEALAGLAVHADGVYIDATFGRGGHSGAILQRLQGTGFLHALDQDPEAAAHAWKTLAGVPNFRMHAANFDRLGEIARSEGIHGRVAGILFDLGVSSPQFDDAARGFSFANDGALDMRMDPRTGESAAQWLARATEREIADVLWRFGEERDSRRVARAIVAARGERAIETTGQLAQIILDAHRGPRQKIHPATRSFQAIRIHVNRELERLESALAQAADLLQAGGRLAVISFHSLEDRIVKRFIRADPARLQKVARHFPGEAECAANPRARSAVLRVAERLQ
jgi:16S rRNA (cytosine1402-N4)-methyltransferase